MATATDLAVLRGLSTYKARVGRTCIRYVGRPRKTARSEAVAIFYEIVYDHSAVRGQLSAVCACVHVPTPRPAWSARCKRNEKSRKFQWGTCTSSCGCAKNRKNRVRKAAWVASRHLGGLRTIKYSHFRERSCSNSAKKRSCF